jgi:hypothetical protein
MPKKVFCLAIIVLYQISKKQEVTEALDTSKHEKITKQDVDAMSAGTVLDLADIEKSVLERLFYQEKINDKIKQRINGKSYKENCDVPYVDLRYIRALYTDFQNRTCIGEMIVNQRIASDVVDILKELYEIRYPIERMVLVDEYNADDNASMEADNSSSFNFRYIDNTTSRSLHSDGLAIDINPFYNPYVRERNGRMQVLPQGAAQYADRAKDCIYYIKKDDACYKIFTAHGFRWGGDWNNSKDYQHFEKSKVE